MSLVNSRPAIKVSEAINVIKVIPTVQAAAYVNGDLVGSLITLSDAVPGGSGVLKSIVMKNSSTLDTIDFVFFDSNPTATTFTDNGTLTIADADLPKILGLVRANTTYTVSGDTILIATNIDLPLATAADDAHTLYMCMITRTGITPTATDAISIGIGITQG